MMLLSLKKQFVLSKHISVIGCGWLGLPLAKHLLKNNYKVKGSTTTASKIETLRAVGIDAYTIQFTETGIIGNIAACLENSTILILNIPPGLRRDTGSNSFVKRIQLLLPYIETSNIKYVLFISSTSVYADDESFPVITEKSQPNPSTEAGRQLLEVENLLIKNTHFTTSILRFSGLFGADRHPAKWISGKKDLKNPGAPINLIHQQDCIAIIALILEQHLWNVVLNAASPKHPTRKNYYTSACKTLNIALPQFEDSKISKGKYIDSTKLVQLLNYEFKIKL